MSETSFLGHEFKLYRDTADSFGSPTWSEVTRAIDVEPSLERTSVEVLSRASNWKKVRAGMVEESLDIKIGYRKDGTTLNTDVAEFESSILDGTTVHLATADGDIATTGTRYRHAEWVVLTKSKPEEQDSEAVITYTLAIADTDNDPATATVV